MIPYNRGSFSTSLQPEHSVPGSTFARSDFCGGLGLGGLLPKESFLPLFPIYKGDRLRHRTQKSQIKAFGVAAFKLVL
jgi:hypothetical protein